MKQLFSLPLLFLVACVPGLADPDAHRAARGLGPGDGGAPVDDGVDCTEEDVLARFAPEDEGGLGCAHAVCHGEGGSPPDLSAGGALSLAERLLDEPAEGDGACVPDLDYVSSSGGTHYLVEKLDGTTPTCGEPMPFLGASLDDAQLGCIQSWIDDVTGGR